MENSIINKNWTNIFLQISKDIRDIVNEYYEEMKDKTNIFPPLNKIFNFTNFTTLEDTKVLIIGQDPYHSLYLNNSDKKYYPQATGLAFSVPISSPIPPSLSNIYDNLLRFGHIKEKPKHGNLEHWAYQGVLLLNTSLTVEKSKPNSHQYIWNEYINEFITILTKNHPNLIIVLWGANALSKMNLIKNKEKHYFIISSHPSPLSVKSKIKEHNSFYETDHFGLINKHLLDNKKTIIDWMIK